MREIEQILDDVLVDGSGGAFEIESGKLSPSEWARVAESARWKKLTYLALRSMPQDELESWYGLITESPPPLAEIYLGDEYSDSADLADPTGMLNTVRRTLRQLSVHGYVEPTQPLCLPGLSELYWWTGAQLGLERDWVAESNIACPEMDLSCGYGSADAVLPLLLDPKASEVRLDGFDVDSSWISELLTQRESPLKRLELSVRLGRDDRDAQQVSELFLQHPDWKQCELLLTGDFEYFVPLEDAGFNVDEAH